MQGGELTIEVVLIDVVITVGRQLDDHFMHGKTNFGFPSVEVLVVSASSNMSTSHTDDGWTSEVCTGQNGRRVCRVALDGSVIEHLNRA